MSASLPRYRCSTSTPGPSATTPPFDRYPLWTVILTRLGALDAAVHQEA